MLPIILGLTLLFAVRKHFGLSVFIQQQQFRTVRGPFATGHRSLWLMFDRVMKHFCRAPVRHVTITALTENAIERTRSREQRHMAAMKLCDGPASQDGRLT